MGALAELIKLGIKTAAKQADKAVPKAVSKVDDISVFPKPQKMFPEDARPAGGEYLNPATQDILTGKNFSKGNISITPEGRPSFKVSPSEKEIVGSPDIKGATQIKTNLFKKKAGWKWNKAPKGYEDAPTLVSVENKGKHYYTLDAQFPEGVNLSRYAKSKTEPRLRPTIKGFVELGKPIGKISVRGKEHPVYDKIINREEGGQVLPVIKREAGGGADYEGAAEAYAAMAEENTPTAGFMDDTDAGLYSDAYGQPGKYVSPEDANKDLTGTDMRFNPLQSPEMKAMTSNPYYFNPNAPKDIILLAGANEAASSVYLPNTAPLEPSINASFIPSSDALTASTAATPATGERNKPIAPAYCAAIPGAAPTPVYNLVKKVSGAFAFIFSNFFVCISSKSFNVS